MPLIAYKEQYFHGASQRIIARANAILHEFGEQGFDLTLRQLYYQFVGNGWLENTLRSYKNLGSVINNARLAGLVDWNHIEDRTRELRGLPHAEDPTEYVRGLINGFHMNWWNGQPSVPEVWVEKDALVSVCEKGCVPWDVDFFSCRGYTSQSEMWTAAMRIIRRYEETGAETVILHLGDHDPSGIDMTRDITERLELFCEYHGCPAPEVRRIALNMRQIHRYEPPPNPAKITDSRYRGYIKKFGKESWELDALKPQVIVDLIETNIEKLIDNRALFDRNKAKQEKERKRIEKAVRWMDGERPKKKKKHKKAKRKPKKVVKKRSKNGTKKLNCPRCRPK